MVGRSCCSRLLRRLRRSPNLDTPQVRYDCGFKVLCLVVLVMSLSWAMNYLMEVAPTMEAYASSPCMFKNYKLTYNARLLFVYYMWFAAARVFTLIPCVAVRVAQVSSGVIEDVCRTYLIHIFLRDGPLYLFIMFALVFWLQLVQSHECRTSNVDLYETLNLFAIYSCILAVFCLVLSYWHHRILGDVGRVRDEAEVRAAPPDTLGRLRDVLVDPASFGDEDDKPYPSECSICLLNWETGDTAKITPCGHAFHAECLGGWLQTARTCPVCRQDLAKRQCDPPLTATGFVRSDPVIFGSPLHRLGLPPGDAGDRTDGENVSPASSSRTTVTPASADEALLLPSAVLQEDLRGILVPDREEDARGILVPDRVTLFGTARSSTESMPVSR